MSAALAAPPEPTLRPLPADPALRAQAIREAYLANPRAMAVQLARQLGVPEVEVVRAMPDEQAVELDASRWEQLLRDFEPLGNVHVVCTNGAVTIEAFGQFGNFSTWGDYFNVQTKSLDMHIQFKKLAHVFAVQKPSHMDGVNTLSVQFFDPAGSSAFKVFLTFGGKAPPANKVQAFEQLRDRYRL